MRRIESSKPEQRQKSISTGSHDSEDGFGVTLRSPPGELLSECDLLPGEKLLIRQSGVVLMEFGGRDVVDDLRAIGSLTITNYKISFIPDGIDGIGRGDVADTSERHSFASDMPGWEESEVVTLGSLERIQRKIWEDRDIGILELCCKDVRQLQFAFKGLVEKQSFATFDKSYNSIRNHAFTETVESCFAFENKEKSISGLLRTGTSYSDYLKSMIASNKSSDWRITDINTKYAFCKSYPASFAVPASVTDEELLSVGKFRSKARLPALAWLSPDTGASICRTSQPLVGLKQHKCPEDKKMVREIARCNSLTKSILIVDCRPHINALAHKGVLGGGYAIVEDYDESPPVVTSSVHAASNTISPPSVSEGTSTATALPFRLTFPSLKLTSTVVAPPVTVAPPVNAIAPVTGVVSDGTTDELVVAEESMEVSGSEDAKYLVEFMDIQNIHVMRKSYVSVKKLCLSATVSDGNWLKEFAATQWLDHCSVILNAAKRVVQAVSREGMSVLVHCSDGWDRTSQVTSLAMLILDPTFRSVSGFELLIESQWLSFGHKFHDRVGFGASSAASSNEISPVFMQWMDVVWQLTCQFPEAFEFNEKYLIECLYHIHSCRFGTFLCNNESERVEVDIVSKTPSLWLHLLDLNMATNGGLRNPLYRPHVQRNSVAVSRGVTVDAILAVPPLSVASTSIGMTETTEKAFPTINEVDIPSPRLRSPSHGLGVTTSTRFMYDSPEVDDSPGEVEARKRHSVTARPPALSSLASPAGAGVGTAVLTPESSAVGGQAGGVTRSARRRGILNPDCSTKALRVWTGYFLQWDKTSPIRSQYSLETRYKEIVVCNRELKNEVNYLLAEAIVLDIVNGVVVELLHQRVTSSQNALVSLELKLETLQYMRAVKEIVADIIGDACLISEVTYATRGRLDTPSPTDHSLTPRLAPADKRYSVISVASDLGDAETATVLDYSSFPTAEDLDHYRERILKLSCEIDGISDVELLEEFNLMKQHLTAIEDRVENRHSSYPTEKKIEEFTLREQKSFVEAILTESYHEYSALLLDKGDISGISMDRDGMSEGSNRVLRKKSGKFLPGAGSLTSLNSFNGSVTDLRDMSGSYRPSHKKSQVSNASVTSIPPSLSVSTSAPPLTASLASSVKLRGKTFKSIGSSPRVLPDIPEVDTVDKSARDSLKSRDGMKAVGTTSSDGADEKNSPAAFAWYADDTATAASASLSFGKRLHGGVTTTVLWVPDVALGTCQYCAVEFNLFRRKHHCRACGRLVCSTCSEHRHRLPFFGYGDELVRVCTPCNNGILRVEAHMAGR